MFFAVPGTDIYVKSREMEILCSFEGSCGGTASVVDVDGEDNKLEGIRSLGEPVGGGERVPRGGPESNEC